MAAESYPVNNLLATAKSREAQRAMLAEMRGERAEAARHFLAVAHMELVLATDYEKAGDTDLALRSRLSAASCFWRAGKPAEAQQMFDSLTQAHPSKVLEIQAILDDLLKTYPAKAG